MPLVKQFQLNLANVARMHLSVMIQLRIQSMIRCRINLFSERVNRLSKASNLSNSFQENKTVNSQGFHYIDLG